jgi:hypothetical protein
VALQGSRIGNEFSELPALEPDSGALLADFDDFRVCRAAT